MAAPPFRRPLGERMFRITKHKKHQKSREECCQSFETEAQAGGDVTINVCGGGLGGSGLPEEPLRQHPSHFFS